MHLAEIKAVKEADGGTYLKVFIPDKQLKWDIERYKYDGKVTGEIRFNDGRTITNEQRGKYYATIHDIAVYTGHAREDIHDYFKFQYCYKYRSEYISMSNCSVTEARAMINLVMDFVIINDIPLPELGASRTDDIDRYLYVCLMKRKCAITRRPGASIHHCTGSRVGMGNNRKKISNKGRQLIALSEEWHKKVHNQGEKEIFKNHRIYGIVIDDIGLKKLRLSEADIS